MIQERLKRAGRPTATWLAYSLLADDPAMAPRVREAAAEGEPALRALAEEAVGLADVGLGADLLICALDEVSWREVRTAILET